MLPSLLAKDIQTGLKQFLVSAFESADAFNHGLMSRFVEDEQAWLKGPYVQVGLPFVAGKSGKTFFSTFETQYPGFSHQENAWERLSTQRQGQSTLVATGTGSGKTECFLYPVLDYCVRARAAGEAGIKALVIYPMNALATDQAHRIAKLIANTAAFQGLRVGLFVGGQTGAASGDGMVMTAEGVITDRETLRKHPPDILLTNYKMLDYLMLRPKDRQLWAANQPNTLRYVVVDELHTFDGAQGTDLALLLRRLRARLKIPENHLICAGTSATLGNASDTSPLREYARQIFGVPFCEDAVVTENRQSVGHFLEDATVDYMFLFRAEQAPLLDPSLYPTPQAAVLAWFSLFFPDEPVPGDVCAPVWRCELGQHLKQHQLFVNLLKLAKGDVVSYTELTEAFARNMPAANPAQVGQVLDALLVLVAWALSQSTQPLVPLVTLRVQLWVRELRRMVGKLSVDSQDVKLRSERDLPVARDGVYLPMIQCSQCRTTGWLSRLVQGTRKVSTQLDEIYNTWFSRRPEAARLYASESISRSNVAGVTELVCVACGTLQHDPSACLACGHQELLSVFRVTAQKTQEIGKAQYTRHDSTCPACGEQDELLLLGARSATLGSQVVESSWASVFNDDKKLIAFSDSVQDAAHRAGFFGARTYLNNVRTALAHVIDEVAPTGLKWTDFLQKMEQQFDQPGSILQMNRESFVAEFIAPNMIWQRDWSVELLEKQQLPLASRLPLKVKKRLLWQAYSEMTYLSHRGRTLERTGKATLSVRWNAVEIVAQELLPRYREQFGAQGLDLETVTWWLWGTLAHMRRRGGVMHPELGAYAADGNVFAFAKTSSRAEWMPKMGNYTPRPVLLTTGSKSSFDKLTSSTRATWYDRWAAAVLADKALLATGQAVDMYKEALQALKTAEILELTTHHQGDTWAIKAQALELDTEVAFVATAGSKRKLAVPRQGAERFLGMPCIDAPESRYEILILQPDDWWARRFSQGDLRRVIAAEHTGLLERPVREALEHRFKSKQPQPWFENLLSATPTLEMGVDIGDLSSVLLCSVPPNQASFLQRIGRAGRRDGNAMATTLADGNSPHDLYFFAETQEMLSGEVAPPGVFLQAAEVLKRQLFAFCMDDWVASLADIKALPDKTAPALDAIDRAKQERFPYVFSDYVLAHEARLFQGFVQLLAGDIDAAVTQRLQDFIQGQGQADGLRTRLHKALEELQEERRTYKNRRLELDKVREKVQKKPQDDATRAEIDHLLRERDKLLELVKEINTRDLLNTLTDAGLIPNYAFPEAGVELKSVLWRKRASDEPGEGAYVTLTTQKYERPAQSALSEFAPENRFYANQRRVEIDQINMNLAKTEDWRFCPSCHHMQNLTVEPDTHLVCPTCGDDMWSDAAQRRTLLRFKQAIANSNDTDVRIDDSADDREPKFYIRQLMADFSSDSIREAWQIGSGTLPFGFEFIAKVTFRDVNFGELVKPGESFKVADKEASRPGFKLCKHCGKVQKPPRRSTDSVGQTHSFDCPKYGNEQPENLLECLYLYREFTSEALRILVPYTKKGVDERVVQSFIAAVQLGLKRRFGGKVDHLRLVLQDEPGKDGGPRRHYVMLYDSVPGGTGYLHQLLAHDADTLAEVLKMALDSITRCSCNDDPEKDGCYRCLYQYRLGRNMEKVSRDTAKVVLGELVGALDQLESVKTISEIFINPNFDSVLEARLIESLKRLSGIGSIPVVKLVQDVVNGKSGYVLEVGSQRYKVELQCNIGDQQGVLVASKPDFVIWPWAAGSKRRPVAIFCDGWAYHKDSLRADALKRSALVASGSFWCWSVTHSDVMAALAGSLDCDLESPLASMSRHAGDKAKNAPPKAQEKAFTQHAVASLLNWLATPIGAQKDDPAVQQLQQNALWLGFLMVPDSQQEQSICDQHLGQWTHLLPSHLQAPGKNFAPSVSKRDAAVCQQIGWWPVVAAKGFPQGAGWQAPGVLVLDESKASDDVVLHLAWRQWLHLFNTTQTLPGMWLVTASGLEHRDYDGLNLLPAATAAQPATQNALSGAWLETVEQLLSPLKPGMILLAKAGATLPEIGPELADEKGRVVAEAEMIWSANHVALLRPDQADMTSVWMARGWTVLCLDDNLNQCMAQPWELVIATALGLTLITHP